MERKIVGLSRAAAAVAAVSLSLAAHFALASPAEDTIPSRVIAPINVTDTVTLAGNTHPSAKTAADQGLVSGDQQLGSMFIVLRRSPTQERALARFNASQLDAASPDYHHWLQPQEFGLKYGPNDADISAVIGWLKAAGLEIRKITDGRNAIEFSGTAAKVQEAFGLEMHRYLVKAGSAIANDRDPTVPRALSPVVAGIAGLNTFWVSGSTRQATVNRSQASPRTAAIGPKPELSVQNASESFAFMTPYDFATVYNSLPLWNASKPILGTGVTIAVIAENDVNPTDVATYRSTFGLPAGAYATKFVGSDPGGTSKTGTVGLELAGAAAPGASLKLVVAASDTLADVINAVSYTVDNNLAPIVTFGFFACEKYLGTSNNAMVNSLWQQGATQGMSIFVAAGDTGSAGCNYNNGTKPDTNGLQVNGFASSPFVTAVGGTDFAWQWGKSTFSTYWNPPSSPVQYESAKSYIIEVPWNVTCTSNILLENQGFLISPSTLLPLPTVPTSQELCNEVSDSVYYTPLLRSAGGGGGFSHCTTLDSSGNCSAGSGYAKPDWQRGSGVPADGRRDLPDVSIFASMGWPDYAGIYNIGEPFIPGTAVLVCYTGAGDPCTYGDFNVGASSIGNQAYGGTGAAAAYWAGILALVEQKQGGGRQGLVNPTLYNLYSGENLTNCKSSAITAGTSCVFYDVAFPLSNGMPCSPGSTPDCTVIGSSSAYGILDAYSGGVGYDQTTGLGSVNITNLVNSWSTAYLPPAPTSSVATGALVDYLGDGRSDFSVWRPSSGNFLVVNQQEGTTSATQWGLSTDVPVVGDFDGDGVTDVAVWRPSTGTWYIIYSSTGQVVTKQWGQSGDVPVVGDFDGDGKTDIAVWRPSTGTWYITESKTGQVVAKQWGSSTDVPVNGDFDGDGKTDIAVWRPATGTWYITESKTGQTVTKQWGSSTDVPVFGDFDGDGKTDIAVWRSSNGMWYVIDSSTGVVTAEQWGESGDVPAPSDFTGSGKTNLAVWRPSNGTWYVNQGASRPPLVKQWGVSTDLQLQQKSAR